MIASVQGLVVGIEEDALIVQVGGVGLLVYVPAQVAAQYQKGDKALLHTYLVVREDSLTLYGFETEHERDFFRLLLGANGVGPRLALSILSSLSVDAIRRAVMNEQADILGRVPGVGKKTAQKIILHLQGKVGAREIFEEAAGLMDIDSEVLEALTALGYSVIEAQTALQSIPRDAPMDVEERLRIALMHFSS
ncbi:MAG TPA: Holliday junction branch migration protein RuvA [Chloroflexi bacterium]|nr:Holliday junction branch migration protein RuvA [Chloroflexota bacterium]HPO59280.1 Holliday junction branch migration protein RuvA [Anaerolineaceae bacterium]